MNKCSWPLGNGQTIDFTIYGSNSNWNKVAGLYIFSYQTKDGWFPLYVGQTDDFSVRLPNHERLIEATRRGATHIHTLVVPQQSKRDTLEKNLIQHLQPPMNLQFR